MTNPAYLAGTGRRLESRPDTNIIDPQPPRPATKPGEPPAATNSTYGHPAAYRFKKAWTSKKSSTPSGTKSAVRSPAA
jgi:hypothetical protein